MGLFYLLTLYCFIRANEKPETGDLRPEGKSSPGWLVLSVVSCLLGMATKENMVSVLPYFLSRMKYFDAAKTLEEFIEKYQMEFCKVSD